MATAIKKNGYVVAAALPPPVLKVNETDRYVKRNGFLMNYEDDYWFKNDYIIFPEDIVECADFIQIENEDAKVLWSWSSTNGDIILDGKLVAFGIKKTSEPVVQTEKCKKCGGEGEVRLMACICMECGSLIWGI